MEICIECPTKIAESTAAVLEDIMEQAGKPYCHKLKLTADAEIGTFWIH